MKAAAPLRATTSCIFALALSLGAAGCAPIMKSTTLQTESVGNGSVLVNFVRPRILKGDATVIDLWDGDTFVGVIGAGSMIQYQTQPADHVFMIRRGSNWSFIKARLAAGKQYFIKVNVSSDYPSLSVVNARKDDRIKMWLTQLEPMEIDPKEVGPYVSKRIGDASEALRDFREGHGSYVELRPEDGI
jgi:hypothetical protein